MKHPDRRQVVAECKLAEASDQPAAVEQFAMIFERLALHYPESKLKPAEEALRKADWLRLVGHLPADIMSEAADAYLVSSERFFPNPGQFLVHAKRSFTAREVLARRARDTLALIAAEKAT